MCGELLLALVSLGGKGSSGLDVLQVKEAPTTVMWVAIGMEDGPLGDGDAEISARRLAVVVRRRWLAEANLARYQVGM